MSGGPLTAVTPPSARWSPVTRWLSLLVVVHVGLGLLYDWATPIFEAPDEGFHFAVVRWISQGSGLPVQRPGQASDWEQEGSQPPLYYLMVAVLTRGFSTADWTAVHVPNPFVRHEPGNPHNINAYRHGLDETMFGTGTARAVHVARWFSLALSAATIVLTYGLALAALPEQEWLALLAAALAALNPKVLFVNASVNNDNLLMLLSTAVLWLVVARPSLQAAVTGRKDVVLGLLLGLAALTKISGLVLWPVAALALGRSGLAAGGEVGRWPPAADGRRGAGRALRSLAGRLGIVFGLALVVCGWWYWRNFRLYGEWLGLNTMVAIAGPRPAMTLLQLIQTEWHGFYLSFWSVFGVFTILPAPWVHSFYAVLTLAAAAGGALALTRRPLHLSFSLVLLGIFCALTLAGVVRWTLQTHASQGRLLFGAIGPLSIFLAAGILSLARRLLRLRAGQDWTRRIALSLSAVLALVAGIIPPAYIAPRYAPPPTVAAVALPAGLRPVQAIFGGQIELLGYSVQDEPVAPGEAFGVTLYWRGRQPMALDYNLALHLLGRGQAAEVGKLDTWPGGGNAATSRWTPGVIYADTYRLPVAVGAEVPTLLWLDIYFWETGAAGKLPVVMADGSTDESVKVLAGRAIPAAAPAYTPETPYVTQFENGITLLGYDASGDGALHLTLYWQLDRTAPLQLDYTVFLHLTDSQGLLLREPADSPPLDGDWPTSAWLPGQQVADTRLIALPPELPTGPYNLRVGLYDPVTGVRLPAFRSDGSRWPEDAILIEDVFVK